MSLLLTTTTASTSTEQTISKRSTGLSRGATAGLGIGIATAGVITLIAIVLLTLHLRQRRHIRAWQRQHDPEGLPRRHEKHLSSATTIDARAIEMHETKEMPVYTATTSLPRRQKSIKDHLMGPLYRDSRTDLMVPPQPVYMRGERAGSREKTDSELDEEFAGRGNRDTVQSFSSRRATRLMMYM